MRKNPGYICDNQQFKKRNSSTVKYPIEISDALSATSVGWQPDVADLRDFTLRHSDVQSVAAIAPEKPQDTDATSVDLREYFPVVDTQTPAVGGTALACSALIEYLQRRATGASTRLSGQFVWQAAQRMQPVGTPGIRAVLKTIARLGIPPAKFVTEAHVNTSLLADPFLYSFPFECRPVYFRLDGPQVRGQNTVQQIRQTLQAGFPVVIGFSVPESLTEGPEIPYRPMLDNVIGGQAALIVGYEDRLTSSTVGAFLIRSSWGRNWGQDGYGWLPYKYVIEGLASDAWTMMSQTWVNSGEFFNPCVSGLRLVGIDSKENHPASAAQRF